MLALVGHVNSETRWQWTRQRQKYGGSFKTWADKFCVDARSSRRRYCRVLDPVASQRRFRFFQFSF